MYLDEGDEVGITPAPPIPAIIHAVHKKLPTMCNFSPGIPPNKWPDDHGWEPYVRLWAITCEVCKPLAEKQVEKDNAEAKSALV